MGAVSPGCCRPQAPEVCDVSDEFLQPPFWLRNRRLALVRIFPFGRNGKPPRKNTNQSQFPERTHPFNLAGDRSQAK
jgi:hypothetical protein